jgi:hypothetical protein
VLHSTGPTPILVLNIRLRIDKKEQQFEWTHGDGRFDERKRPFPMSWQGIQPELEPAPPAMGGCCRRRSR